VLSNRILVIDRRSQSAIIGALQPDPPVAQGSLDLPACVEISQKQADSKDQENGGNGGKHDDVAQHGIAPR
jgi:hypothetical protein